MNKAQALHQAALIIDAQAPQVNNAFVVTGRMREVARKLSAKGLSFREVKAHMSQLLLDEMRHDPRVRTEYEAVWRASGVTVASSSLEDDAPPNQAFDEAMVMTAATRALLDVLRPKFELATDAESIRRIHAEGRHGIIMNFQNTTAFGSDLDRVDLFCNLGLRIVQLTYNLRNLVADGCLEPADGGLSLFGRRLVKRLNRQNILIDLSHCGRKTVHDVLEHSEQPVIMSHISCDAVYPHDRAQRDEELRAVAQSGGFVGLLLVPAFIQPDFSGDLDAFKRQLEHAIEVVGIDRVGIGTDYGRCAQWQDGSENQETPGDGVPPETFDWGAWQAKHRLGYTFDQVGYNRWTDWPNLTALLIDMGLSEGEVRGVLGDNFLRVYEQVVG